MVKKALVLKAPGTNNDSETCWALERAGAEAVVVHINRVASGEVKLNDFGVMVIPGGFSYGDELGAGKMFSLFLKYRFREEFEKFVKKGNLAVGICNGFQVLVKTNVFSDFCRQKSLTLTSNECGSFICRWTGVEVDTGKFWFRGLPRSISLPIAHAEGKFTGRKEALEDIKEGKQAVITYLNNPNGSYMNIAGIVNRQGNVLGLMPHPERYIFKYQYPGVSGKPDKPWGMKIYRNIVKNA